MAARGSEAKAIVMNGIKEIFPDAFLCNDGKELRVPIKENGEIVQIKVALTAAKVNIEREDTQSEESSSASISSETIKGEVLPPTEEEKQDMKKALEVLGF